MTFPAASNKVVAADLSRHDDGGADGGGVLESIVSPLGIIPQRTLRVTDEPRRAGGHPGESSC